MAEYIPQVHSHVLMKRGFFDGYADRLPVPIMHHTGRFVWIAATYIDVFPDDVLPVGDSRDNGYDQYGNRVMSVPVSYVERYVDDSEAEQYARAAVADEKF